MNKTPNVLKRLDTCKLFHLVLVLILCGYSISTWSQNLQDQVELARSTVDGGGANSSADTFSLTGTIGQHDASTTTATGGQFLVTGGIWANARTNDGTSDLIFADGFEAQSINNNHINR